MDQDGNPCKIGEWITNNTLRMPLSGKPATGYGVQGMLIHPDVRTGDTTLVTMDMDNKTHALLSEIADHSGSKANAIREALSLYAHVLKERADGGKLIIEKGNIRQQIMPFLKFTNKDNSMNKRETLLKFTNVDSEGIALVAEAFRNNELGFYVSETDVNKNTFELRRLTPEEKAKKQLGPVFAQVLVDHDMGMQHVFEKIITDIFQDKLSDALEIVHTIPRKWAKAMEEMVPLDKVYIIEIGLTKNMSVWHYVISAKDGIFTYIEQDITVGEYEKAVLHGSTETLFNADNNYTTLKLFTIGKYDIDAPPPDIQE